MLPFVWWTLVSFGVVSAYQVIVSWLVMRYLELHHYTGLNLTLVQGALTAAGCLAAGLVVGVVSPGRRILEPALGALLACLVVPGTSWLAFPVTFAGAWLGERWSRP